MNKILQEQNKTVAVYARVSTSAQEDEGTIETQLLAVNKFANENEYEIIKEYRDDGWSGDNLVRPSLDQLRFDAKKNIWDAVLIYDPDRLARRYSYQELVMDELREAGVEVIFVTVSTPKNSEDKILYGVRGLFSEYERTKIAERFRLGKLRKVTEGHILTTEAPYGYQYIRNDKEKKEHGYYVINEEESRVVRMIFSWVGDEGLSLRQVVRKLQELEIKPRKSKRGVWNTSTLSTMLRNRVYIGEAHYGSSYAVVPTNPTNKEKYRQVKKSSRRTRPEEEWIANNIPVPKIIENDLFVKVREQLKTNFDFQKRNTKNEYLLGGKIDCSCGTKRCGEGPQHGKHLYYRCSNRTYNFPLPRTCNEKGINARIADKLVWDKVVELMTSPDLLSAQVRRWMDSRKNNKQSTHDNVEMVKGEIAKLKVKEDRYSKAYGEEVLSLEKLRELITPVRNRIAELEERLKKSAQEAREVSTDSMPSEADIQTFAAAAVETLKGLNFESKRAIIRDIVEKVIGTQKQLQVVGNVPLVLNYVKYKTEYRNCGVTECR